jgi:DNA-binding response OmpR family regulator
MSMNFLVIEDDDDLREAIVVYLASRRHRVTACGSIAEATTALSDLSSEGEPPDAVVSHIHLNDGDGVSFYIRASSRFPDMRWILTSPEREQMRISSY